MKKTIGYIEPVTLISNEKEIKITAKIDTGAYRSSIDMKLASELGLKIVDMKKIRNISESQMRPLVNIELVLAGERIKTKASVADRNHMEYPMIVGRIDLRGFLIDPTKKSK